MKNIVPSALIIPPIGAKNAVPNILKTIEINLDYNHQIYKFELPQLTSIGYLMYQMFLRIDNYVDLYLSTKHKGIKMLLNPLSTIYDHLKAKLKNGYI